MNKILVLSRRDDRETYDRVDSMIDGMKTIRSLNEYTGAEYENLVFSFDGSELKVSDAISGRDLSEFDVIFLIGWFKTKMLDDVARSAAHYAAYKNVPFANKEAYYGRSFSKLSQCVIAITENLAKVTPFVFSMNKRFLKEAIDSSDFINYPYILKATAASRGDNNHLITDSSHFDEVLGAIYNPPKYFIAQTFIPNDGDYRIITMGDTVTAILHRQGQEHTHLNNTSKGGSAEVVDISTFPQTVKNQAIATAKVFNREVSGIDMIQHRDTGEYYFLEANNMPQLSTGSNISTKMTALDQYLTKLAEE